VLGYTKQDTRKHYAVDELKEKSQTPIEIMRHNVLYPRACAVRATHTL